jgi:hypothetical protein
MQCGRGGSRTAPTSVNPRFRGVRMPVIFTSSGGPKAHGKSAEGPRRDSRDADIQGNVCATLGPRYQLLKLAAQRSANADAARASGGFPARRGSAPP